MNFYSTNRNTPAVTLEEAVTKGLAADNGLFMPEKINRLPECFFHTIEKLSFREIALETASTLLQDSIEKPLLKAIIDDAINFDAPAVRIKDNTYALELFHGPTLAFKDFGARFMARLTTHFVKNTGRELTVLVATSGDTGSAVASGFLGIPGTRVIILYPSGKVSHIQEQQLTTLGQNITALEIEGTFDDCQRMVKQAFPDAELNARHMLTSANSINIARLIPQMFYYVYVYAQLKKQNKPLVVSVPSGNFGNLTAGLIAKAIGTPIAQFIAATNINDIVPKYLQSGLFEPKPSRQTISNAMDVGHPSNFTRMLDLYHHSVEEMRKDITGYRFTDEETRAAMQDVFQKYGYVLDPHGAVGYLGLEKYSHESGMDFTGVFLETAHPAKFIDIVEAAIGNKVVIPERLQQYMSKQKEALRMPADFGALKKFLLR